MEKTTMDDIAGQAEYSKATLYVYFRSKEEIFYYLGAQSTQQLLYRIKNQVHSQGDPVSVYFALCRLLQSHHQEHPAHFELLTRKISPQQRLESPSLTQIYQCRQRIGELLLEFFRRASGVFRRESANMQAVGFFWSALCGILLFQDPPPEQSFEWLLRSFLENPALVDSKRPQSL